MKYIKQEVVYIKPIEFFGMSYYQIGTEDWNIVVGLGGHPRQYGILPTAYPYDFCSYGERKDN